MQSCVLPWWLGGGSVTRRSTLMGRRSFRCFRIWRRIRQTIIVGIVFVLFVEIGKRVAYVLDFKLWSDPSKVERMNMDRADEAWQRHLLKPVVDKCAYRFCTTRAIWAAGEGVPVDVDRHCCLSSVEVSRRRSCLPPPPPRVRAE